MTMEREIQIVMIAQGVDGAYLVGFHGEAWRELTSIEQYEAFANLKTAKRFAIAQAKEAEYVGPFRWEGKGGNLWLSAMYDEEEQRREQHRAELRAWGIDPDEADVDEIIEAEDERRRLYLEEEES